MGQIFYFNGGRYDTTLHGNMPEGAIALTDEEYDAIKNAGSNGKVVREDASGRPIVTDPPPPTAEELAASAHVKRCGHLRDAAIRIAPLQDAVDLAIATPEEEAALLAWKQFRIDLNRIEQQSGFPQSIDWPVPPA